MQPSRRIDHAPFPPARDYARGGPLFLMAAPELVRGAFSKTTLIGSTWRVGSICNRTIGWTVILFAQSKHWIAGSSRRHSKTMVVSSCACKSVFPSGDLQSRYVGLIQLERDLVPACRCARALRPRMSRKIATARMPCLRKPWPRFPCAVPARCLSAPVRRCSVVLSGGTGHEASGRKRARHHGWPHRSANTTDHPPPPNCWSAETWLE